MGSRISNSRKIPGPKIRELGGNNVVSHLISVVLQSFILFEN